MRNRPEDIYRKEPFSRFGRRRRSRREPQAVAPPAPVAAPPDPAAETDLAPEFADQVRRYNPHSPGGAAPAALPAYGGRPERRRRQRHRGPNLRLLIVGITGLLAVLILYLALAAYFRMRRGPAHPLIAKTAPVPAAAATHPDGPPAAPEAPPPSTEDAPTDALIADIKESVAFLDRLHKPPMSKLSAAEQAAACESRLTVTPTLLSLILETARLHGEAGNYRRAAELYRRTLAATPSNREARFALAQTQLKAGNHDGALLTATWMLEEESFSLDARQVIATVYLSRNQPLNAIPHLRAIAEGDSFNVMARNNLAVAYTQVREYDRAIKLFQSLITQDGNNPVTYNNLAICLAQKGDLVEATATLRQAAKKFGAAFVAAWIKAREFDGVRATLPFQNLLSALEAGRTPDDAGAGVLLDSPLKPPKVEPKPSDALPPPGVPVLSAPP